MQNEFCVVEQANTKERDPYIDLVGKVLNVVETLASAPNGLSLQELAARTRYVKSSVHRILHSLKRHGYVEQGTSRGTYKLGLQFAVLGRSVRHSLVDLARRHLNELLERFDETVYLAVVKDDMPVFVEVRETSRDLRLVGPMTATILYHATAAGKAIAAFQPRDRQDALLQSTFPALTAKTLTNPERIREEWELVARQGYAVNFEESIVGAMFLAAPIFDSRRAVCGSISIGVPKPRFSAELGREMTEGLVETCGRLSDALERTRYVHQNYQRSA